MKRFHKNNMKIYYINYIKSIINLNNQIETTIFFINETLKLRNKIKIIRTRINF